MEDGDAAAGQTFVPPFLLSILYHVVFVFETIVANQIGCTLVCQCWHITYR